MKTDIIDKTEGFDPKNTLCDISEMSSSWNKTNSKTNNNIYTTYIRKPENHHRLMIIDMGTFCLRNDITPDLLKLSVAHVKEVAALVAGEKISDKNKIVIMTEEDYEDYEKFKKYQAFHKAQN